MVDTPYPKPKNGTPSPPFKRGQIEWGRPPQQLFRVGPPPRAPGSAPAPPQTSGHTQRRTAGSGILSGSLIPRPTPPVAAPLPPVTPTLPAPTPVIQAAPLPPVERPAPHLPESRDEPSAAPVAAPVVAEDPIVPPYIAAAVRSRSGVPMAGWIAGAVVVVVLAGTGWWVLQPEAPVPAVIAATPLIPDATTPSVPPTPVEAASVVDAPIVVPVEAEPTTRPTTNTTTVTPVLTRPASTTVTPSLTPRLNTETVVPRIETAPLVVVPAAPPPTAAERPATDPDAPIQTRPQPLS